MLERRKMDGKVLWSSQPLREGVFSIYFGQPGPRDQGDQGPETWTMRCKRPIGPTARDQGDQGPETWTMRCKRPGLPGARDLGD
ncbi:unnamed protein product [Pieris brassicae]|uniref:Uncharacterized protein n=1 Tax=Pieris brassicae TaxID=7116 RepID=A0A9P0TS52_PIEBR|nr:unnamed protein product [Pieris brassicae]